MVPTVFLVGIDELEQIPAFLDLGLVVVVSPDPTTLRRWRREQDLVAPALDADPHNLSGIIVEMDAHRISSRGVALSLSEMEFRVLAGFGRRSCQALSFAEIRALGWGDDVQLPIDVYAIRSLIQRLRAKMRAIDATVTIQPVRGFGFRLEPRINDAKLKQTAVATAGGRVDSSGVAAFDSAS
jgi:hypothetical protein